METQWRTLQEREATPCNWRSIWGPTFVPGVTGAGQEYEQEGSHLDLPWGGRTSAHWCWTWHMWGSWEDFCHWWRSSVVSRQLLVNMKRMLFIQCNCNLLFILANYSPLTEVTGGKTSLLNKRPNSLFQVLTGEPSPLHLQQDALTDSEVLARLVKVYLTPKQNGQPCYVPHWNVVSKISILNLFNIRWIFNHMVEQITKPKLSQLVNISWTIYCNVGIDMKINLKCMNICINVVAWC